MCVNDPPNNIDRRGKGLNAWLEEEERRETVWEKKSIRPSYRQLSCTYVEGEGIFRQAAAADNDDDAYTSGKNT